MIIGLAGYAGSGKDTLGRALVTAYGFERIAFADKVKELALKIDPTICDNETFSDGVDVPLSWVVEREGWETAKRSPQVRELLQRIGASVRDTIDPDAWLDAATRDMLYGKNYVITDVRYPNEVEYVRDMGGVIWWVKRDGIGPVNSHESENSISPSDADLIVDNTENPGSLGYLELHCHDIVSAALNESSNYG